MREGGRPLKTSLVLSLALLAPLMSGCPVLLLGAAAGAGGAIYIGGRLQEDFDSPVLQVADATRKGLQDLQLPLLHSKADKLTAEIESEFADDAHVWISIHAVESKTRVTIRVGVLGDEERSRRILEAIKKHLPPKAE